MLDAAHVDMSQQPMDSAEAASLCRRLLAAMDAAQADEEDGEFGSAWIRLGCDRAMMHGSATSTPLVPGPGVYAGADGATSSLLLRSSSAEQELIEHTLADLEACRAILSALDANATSDDEGQTPAWLQLDCNAVMLRGSGSSSTVLVERST